VYEQANKSINEGLSLGARIFLGSIAALFGAMMVLTGEGAANPAGVIGFGVFCILIAVVCVVRGRVRQFVGSVIGTLIFLAGLAYLAHQLLGGTLISASRGEPSVLNAVLYLVFIGIPGATYAYKARFGFARQA
jgi:tellurite resistance protein TehA-like permease